MPKTRFLIHVGAIIEEPEVVGLKVCDEPTADDAAEYVTEYSAEYSAEDAALEDSAEAAAEDNAEAAAAITVNVGDSAMMPLPTTSRIAERKLLMTKAMEA